MQKHIFCVKTLGKLLQKFLLNYCTWIAIPYLDFLMIQILFLLFLININRKKKIF